MIRVAVTSSDGKVIDQHFGHCSEFTIAEVQDSGWRIVEKRKTEPVCENFSHRPDRVREVADLLSDCGFLLTYCIGPYPRRLFLGRGIDCLETPEEEPISIDFAMERLGEYLSRRGSPGRPEEPGGDGSKGTAK